MADKPTTHIIRDVQALYPKINQTYKYDSKAEKEAEPCLVLRQMMAQSMKCLSK